MPHRTTLLLAASLLLISPCAAQTSPAATPAPPAPPRAPQAAGSASLSSLVAEAIKRKLERINSTKNPSIEPPPTDTGPSPADSAAAPPRTLPSIDPAPLAPAAPNPAMMTGGSRLMMGSPADGSPAYVRVASDTKRTPAPNDTAAAPSTPPANPFARPADPMESGTEPAAAASEPGPSHTPLDIFIGTWDVSANFDTGPGQPPETASGTMVNTWQLGGRWLRQEYDGKMTSLGAFQGLGFIGYDNIQKTYIATWMDTLSTACISSRGAFDENTSTLTLTGEFSVPGGEKYRQRQVMTILNPDRYAVTMYVTGPDGVEFKTGNLEYVRAVKRVTAAK